MNELLLFMSVGTPLVAILLLMKWAIGSLMRRVDKLEEAAGLSSNDEEKDLAEVGSVLRIAVYSASGVYLIFFFVVQWLTP